MLDLEANPSLKRLFFIARMRVTVGFVVALFAFWFAQPNINSLVIGACVAAIGELLRVWAAGHLRKGTEVTCSGPYRFFRHPLYVGSFIVGLGFAVAASDFFSGALVIFYLITTLLVAVFLEEATLKEDFGTEYQLYIRGKVEPTKRRFSFSQGKKNGEYKTVIGFIFAMGILGFKILVSSN